jgi:glycogen debranching enzyme
MQQSLYCKMLLQLGEVIGNTEFAAPLSVDREALRSLVNEKLWDSETQFYHDLSPDGELSPVKSIGAYWSILADIVPPERLAIMLQHLRDESVFNRPHRVPTQAADGKKDVDYYADGHYWLGGVWSPTNYMVLSGLSEQNAHDLAYEIARNHVDNVAKVFVDTGTLWENYAPESPGQGNPARSEFVGWTGVSAITIPIEYVVGIRLNYLQKQMTWHIRLTDERHGVLRYPLGQTATADLIYEPQTRTHQNRSDIAFQLNVIIDNKPLAVTIKQGQQTVELGS